MPETPDIGYLIITIELPSLYYKKNWPGNWNPMWWSNEN